ncbi:MAG TPA: AAA family ATPase [Bryobacteraceae bacterium]|nr:AAA family ATPase [Bryobacteraceae bacterium]
MLDAIWADVHVQPEVLKRHILDIRNALGDDAKEPTFIETLPRRGYQFIAPVRDESPSQTATAAPAALEERSRLVGRERVLGELEQTLRKAVMGQRQVIFVSGEAGGGKTCLLDEFQRRAGVDSTIRHARGQCVEGYGGKEAYYPVLEALGQLCRQPGGDSVVQVLASHAPTWLVQFPALVTREQRETLRRELLGATRERMLREIGEAIETITAARPIVMILEDLQWADPSTVDLLSVLARGRAAAKLMIVGTYRPVDVSPSEHPLKRMKQGLRVHQLCQEIVLAPLSEEDIEEYLGGGSKATSVPEGLAGLVHRHSEGNPLFMVAALEHMTQRGFISGWSGNWKLNVPLEEIDLEVPEDLRAMIEAQIERLSAEEQHALEAASVNGVMFSARVNANAAGLEEEKFEDLCEGLFRRQQMVRAVGLRQFPDGSASQRYEFAHALYREVFYHRQTPGRRARLHLRVGDRLEELFHNHESEVAAELAEHFEQAGDSPRAVKYLQMAADSAKRRYAPRDAVAILKQAEQSVERLSEPDRPVLEMQILEQLGMFYMALADIPEAVQTYRELVALADHHGRVDVEIRALLDMAMPAALHSAQLYLETLDRALELSARQEDSLLGARTRARCLAWRAVAGRWRAEDAENCRKAMAEIEQSAGLVALAEHRVWYAYLQSLSSQYRDAQRALTESVALLLTQDNLNPFFGGIYHIQRYLIPRNYRFLGNLGQSLKEVDATVALFENADYARGQEMLIHKALTHLYAMDFAGVVAICDSIADSVRLPAEIRLWHILTGSAQAMLGNHELALEHLTRVRDLMEHEPLMDDWFRSMPLQAGFVELWLQKGDLCMARKEAEHFLDVSLATAERTFQGLAWEAATRVAIAGRDWARADQDITQGLSTIQGYEVPLASWRVHGTAAECCARAGDIASADRHRALSRATIMKLASSLDSYDPLRKIFLSAPPVRRILDWGGQSNKGAAVPSYLPEAVV